MKTLGRIQLGEAKRFLSARAHGDGANALERFLGLDPGELLDLSASMNPVAPSYEVVLTRRLGSLKSYPDPKEAAAFLAGVLEVDADQLILSNGGAEAIALVAQVVKAGHVRDPEFSLYRRHITRYSQEGPWWASNPNNPIGTLLEENEVPFVIDEAFYQMATGHWSRRDFERGSFVVGSLTKLFALPGLRMGYLIAPSSTVAARLRRLQPQWALNSLAAAALPDLISGIDLNETHLAVSRLRGDLMSVLTTYGASPRPSCANYVFVPDAKDLFDRLLERKVLVRDTHSFGLNGGVRIAVPDDKGLYQVEQALFPKKLRKRSGANFRGGLMVVGTTSDSGKSTLVTALCRVLSDRGIAVAPFKAQNMSLNSSVTPAGYEIGRAQARQAHAARIDSEAAMNPILLKPTSEMTSQVVVMGEPLFETNARDYQTKKSGLLASVIEAYNDLASRFEVVILEGAGSPAEINLIDNDLVNLGLAHKINARALLVGDIDRGGVFASLYGTLQILSPKLSSLICGFVINKIRGDATLLDSGISQLEALTKRPVFGVLPYLSESLIDAEDSLGLSSYGAEQSSSRDALDIAVISLPRISNFTDFDPLVNEPGCVLRMIASLGQLGSPDLIIIPGSKSTIDDLNWLRRKGFDEAITQHLARGCIVLGICGGYQILGKEINDEVESKQGRVNGLGLLDVQTLFLDSKVTLRRSGVAPRFGQVPVSGYQIHKGRVTPQGGRTLFELSNPSRTFQEVGLTDGAVDDAGQVFGTTLHGVFENDEFRSVFLSTVGRARSKSFESRLNFAQLRESQIDYLAKFVSKYIDIDALFRAASINI
ncbi:MAG: cobyric acid synthase [Actinomycetota bacterium]|nr:MAG: cobyric acid synthase [Actinomycetota bacterium]